MAKRTNYIGLSRRGFLKGFAGIGLGTITASWGISSMSIQKAIAATNPSELTMVWHIVNNQDDRFQPVLKRWACDYPDVKVNFIQVPNIEQVTEKVVAMFAAGQNFDVCDPTLGAGAALVNEGVIRALDGLPGLEEYFEELIPSAVPLLKIGGKTWAIPQWIGSACGAFNMKLFEKAGVKSPPRTWEEVLDISLKAKKDGIVKYPIIFPAGVGVDHGNSVWYAIVASAGGTITDKQGNPTLGPGSKAREMLKWYRKCYLDWKIADPRSLELRYYPGAKAFATGDYLMHLCTRQVFFTAINGGDSPTAGQNQIMLLPGNETIITCEWATIGSQSENPEWAWKLLQYLMGRTKDGDLLGPMEMGKESLTPFPIKIVDMYPEIKKLYKRLFGSIDVYKETLRKSIAHNVVAPAILMPWWNKWNDQVNSILQQCLRGMASADEACDQMTAAGKKAAKNA